MKKFYWFETLKTIRRPAIEDGKRKVYHTTISVLKTIPLKDVYRIEPGHSGQIVIFAKGKFNVVDGAVKIGDPSNDELEQMSTESYKEIRDTLHHADIIIQTNYLTEEKQPLITPQKEMKSFSQILLETRNRYAMIPINDMYLEEIRQYILQRCASDLGRPVDGNLLVCNDDDSTITIDYDDDFFMSLGEIV